jgi:hypothetical protein
LTRLGREVPRQGGTVGADGGQLDAEGSPLRYPALGDPIAPGIAVTGAELVWGLWHEGALDVDDLIDRRCRVGLVPTDRRAALTIAEAVLAEHATGA